MRRIIGIFCLVLASGCVVSRGEDPSRCDPLENDFCPPGFDCFANQCIPDGGCVPGTANPCTTPKGAVCPAGVVRCRPDYTWEECDAPKEVCNGVDDDCNGFVDDGVGPLPACELTLGTCAGHERVCGNFATSCDKQSYGFFYEPVEVSCDGIDNDCDGFMDARPDGGHIQTTAARSCRQQEGVCSGALAGCFTNHCDEGILAAHAAASGRTWERIESTCFDSQDNDCDGRIDFSGDRPLIQVSAATPVAIWQSGDQTRIGAWRQTPAGPEWVISRVSDLVVESTFVIDAGSSPIAFAASAPLAVETFLAIASRSADGGSVVELRWLSSQDEDAFRHALGVAAPVDVGSVTAANCVVCNEGYAFFTANGRLFGAWGTRGFAAASPVLRPDGGQIAASAVAAGVAGYRAPFVAWVDGQGGHVGFLRGGLGLENELSASPRATRVAARENDVIFAEPPDAGGLIWFEAQTDGGLLERGRRAPDRPVLSMRMAEGPRGRPLLAWTESARDGGPATPYVSAALGAPVSVERRGFGWPSGEPLRPDGGAVTYYWLTASEEVFGVTVCTP